MSSIPPLVGMIHLAALPGSPGFAGSMRDVVADAVGRAELLADAGFRAAVVENFGDVPFYAEAVPAETVAAVTACAIAVREGVGLALGINVLRNDALASLAIAAAVDARFVRINVLSGTMYTDQGPLVGRAAEVARRRREIAPHVEIWADVFVKHATPPPGATIEQAALDTWHRGGADSLIVSGPGTGSAPATEDLERVRRVVPEAPLVVGSGATGKNLGELADRADHIIVGTDLEEGGRPGARIDPDRLRSLVDVARDAGLM